MELPQWFDERAQRDAPLADLTWYKLGGSARYLASPTSVEELRQLVQWASNSGEPLHILGGGANVLIADDGVDGVVVRLDSDTFNAIEFEDDLVHAGAGVDLMRLARDCAYRGLSGMECMAGIPGTVGGAVRMNAGGHAGQFSDLVLSVRLMDRAGNTVEMPSDRMGFGYRHSGVGDRIVTAVTLQLSQAPIEETVARFKELWNAKKLSQPMAARSAGCVFKNPPGDSAGRLIDQAGMKGVTVGGARVSEKHANFIVAGDEATTHDVLMLAEMVRNAVLRSSGTELEMEIDVW